MVGIICPPVEIWLTDLTKSGGAMAAPLAPTGLIIHSDSLTIFLTSLVFVDTVKIGNDFRHKLCLRNFYLPGNPLGLTALTVFHFLETQF